MNHAAEVVLDWADGTYLFRLTVKQIIELEEKCGAAFAVIHNRLAYGAYTISDVTETIRLGLIGGGMDPVRALKMTERYGGVPLAPNYQTARLIIGAAMFGFEKSPLGKNQAAATVNQSASTPPNSSGQPMPSASKSMSLDEFHSGDWLQ